MQDIDKDFKPVKLIVIERHISEYPRPITFAKGAPLTIGELYAGDKNWNEWYFCSTPGQEAGWVPGQLIERISDTMGIAKEDYSAKELDVNPGEVIWGSKVLNGWVWCTRISHAEEGWVPLMNIRKVDDED